MSRSETADTTALPQAEPDEPGRPQRADARRNRDLLLAAAAEVYDERGVDASLEEIARRAGVGIGTLYRHFPTRDAVTEAVYRREVGLLCDGVDDLLAGNATDAALALWMRTLRGLRREEEGHGDGAEVGARRRRGTVQPQPPAHPRLPSARWSPLPPRPARSATTSTPTICCAR